MKTLMRIICIVALFLFTNSAFGADVKVTALPADSSPTADDMLMTVDDPGGTPTSKKATIQNVINAGLPVPGPIGGTTPNTGVFSTLTGRFMAVVTTTGNRSITSADFGKSIRFNHVSTTGTMTLPANASGNDGARVTFVKIGDARLVIKAPASSYIHDSNAAGTAYADSKYATITLEYVHAITTWVIISAVGTWTTT